MELLGLTSYLTVERSPVFINTVGPEYPQSHANHMLKLTLQLISQSYTAGHLSAQLYCNVRLTVDPSCPVQLYYTIAVAL